MGMSTPGTDARFAQVVGDGRGRTALAALDPSVAYGTGKRRFALNEDKLRELWEQEAADRGLASLDDMDISLFRNSEGENGLPVVLERAADNGAVTNPFDLYLHFVRVTRASPAPFEQKMSLTVWHERFPRLQLQHTALSADRYLKGTGYEALLEAMHKVIADGNQLLKDVAAFTHSLATED